MEEEDLEKEHLLSKLTVSPESPDLLFTLNPTEKEFFEKILDCIYGPDDEERERAFHLLSENKHIESLVPYLCAAVIDFIHLNMEMPTMDCTVRTLRVIKHLVTNQHVNIADYLHRLIPAIVTSIISNKVTECRYENHWFVRNFSLMVLKSIYDKYSKSEEYVKPMVINIFLKILKDCGSHSLSTLYGAIKGIGIFGEVEIEKFILPHIYNIGKMVKKQDTISLRFAQYNQYAQEAKKVKQLIISLVAPILLKKRDANDGTASYPRKFGYLGKLLYVQMKKLEKLETPNQ
ncbi:transcription initiation factor TFIID subunit 6-like [Diorhabda carinulata]|uniref:transcription initiation factor TFIID subunit 6-like n=1 Tax=Diorhabda carinulata TaxID=1163345 RepID=UPI0025A0A2A0|nr:transcription initiation factor TFIID subunit 6-like [Diorhabda carinulata]